MKTSESSSPDGSDPIAPPRKRIYLIGPSVPIDTKVHAVRRDLAELALAPQVFAQHYAVPMRHIAQREIAIHAAPRADSATVSTLAAQDNFHVLDLGQDWAWGRGDAKGSVGYVRTDALTLA